jgi:hypothetical protein
MLHTDGSFRDPCGFLFQEAGVLYRQINQRYRPHYERLRESGLYEDLTQRGLLLPHDEEGVARARTDDAFTVIRPRLLPFVSYPYEWCFGQLRDAALATLEIQRRSLERGLTLKDASAYNMQFVEGRPVLIDTLSFEIRPEGAPWVAYRQFCQHFLAPLALMSYRDVSLGSLLRLHIDGVPLELASKLLPARSRLRLSLQLHIHAHAKMQKKYADRPEAAGAGRRRMTQRALINFIESLRQSVEGLQWKPAGTTWSEYYQGDSYDETGLDHKKELVEAFLRECRPTTVWDMGANTGLYSRIASGLSAFTVAWDVDPGAVELNYHQMVRERETLLLPLVCDLTNPSPALGWAHEERMSMGQRGPADTVLALALVHHLAIANNVPLDRIARFFSVLGKHLIVEFIPRDDPKVQRLLASRDDVFPDYKQAGFESAFSTCFEILTVQPIRQSARLLYLMRAKEETGASTDRVEVDSGRAPPHLDPQAGTADA